MAKVYDTTDLVYNDDFGISPTGDILASDLDASPQATITPEGIYKRAYSSIPLSLYPIARHILDVCKAYFEDWKYNPQAAASLDRFNGEANTQKLEELIKLSITKGLSTNKLVDLRDLDIDVIPITKKLILVRLGLRVAATKKNSMTNFILLNALYNTALGNVVILES